VLGWAGRRPARWGTGKRGGAIAALGVHDEAQVLLSHRWLGGEKLAERYQGGAVCGEQERGVARRGMRRAATLMGDKRVCR
jgi:hypothetical protein